MQVEMCDPERVGKIAKKEFGRDTHSRVRSEWKKQGVGDYRGMATIDGDVLGISRQCKRTVDGDYRRVAAIDSIALRIAKQAARVQWNESQRNTEVSGNRL